MNRAALIGWICISLLAASVIAANFDLCQNEAKTQYDKYFLNGTSSNATDLFWPRDKEPLGYNPIDYSIDDGSPWRVPWRVLTLEGCKKLCNPHPQYNDAIEAFQILTTWVLPAIALMSQLPYESISVRKSKNLIAFGNWIGAPAAAMTTTFWNIRVIRECAVKASFFTAEETRNEIRHALYILSCVNQYEYPRHRPADKDLRRDLALLRGTLYPYFKTEAITPYQRKLLANFNQHLAFQLRMQRRKGVYPIFISIGWFGIAFAFSIGISFNAIGDNSTAHSLALGLLLSWVPIMLFGSVIDRNPVSATRCSELIQRWLFNIDRMFSAEASATPPVYWRARVVNSVDKADETYDFDIGEYMGQGRTLRYCGIADTVLAMIGDSITATLDLPKMEAGEEHAKFRNKLTHRPRAWLGVWLIGQAIVSISFGMAFMVSFNTPTIGLGCRSLLYLIWWLLTLPSWLVLGLFQEPWEIVRIVMVVPNLLAAAAVFCIMLVQAIGLFNNCECKSSVFGTALFGRRYGGYVYLQDASFFKIHYGVLESWGVGTGIGGTTMVLAISWLAWQWHKSSNLWRETEKTSMWVRDDASLAWLT